MGCCCATLFNVFPALFYTGVDVGKGMASSRQQGKALQQQLSWNQTGMVFRCLAVFCGLALVGSLPDLRQIRQFFLCGGSLAGLKACCQRRGSPSTAVAKGLPVLLILCHNPFRCPDRSTKRQGLFPRSLRWKQPFPCSSATPKRPGAGRAPCNTNQCGSQHRPSTLRSFVYLIRFVSACR